MTFVKGLCFPKKTQAFSEIGPDFPATEEKGSLRWPWQTFFSLYGGRARHVALRRRLSLVLPERNAILHQSYGQPGFDLDELVEQATGWGERLRPHIVDTTNLVQDALAADKYVILEGAQGTLLDLDHGSYPFVTSSSTMAGGLCSGLGVAPTCVTGTLGVFKAYATRVGAGPMPTELSDGPEGFGERLRQRGHEFGTTTGRPKHTS